MHVHVLPRKPGDFERNDSIYNEVTDDKFTFFISGLGESWEVITFDREWDKYTSYSRVRVLIYCIHKASVFLDVRFVHLW